MNAIVNKLLLAGDALMNLYQKCFGNCLDLYIGPFTKNKRIKKNIKEKANSRYSYQNELNKACFQYDVAYGDFKDLNRRVAAYKVLRHKVFDIAKNPKYDGYQKCLTPMVYKVFYKKRLLVVLKMRIFQRNN